MADKTVSLDKKVPDFVLPATGGKTWKLSAAHGRHLVVYFYPRDNTTGCTQEGIDFRDRPVETVALHSSEVLVREAGSEGETSRFIYQIRADDVQKIVGSDSNDAATRNAILRVVEPIAGEVTLERYQAVRDAQGRIIAYNAWITR